MKIKEFREKQGISQRELAIAMKTSEEKIIHWENGDEKPSEEEIIRLATFFECPPSEILKNPIKPSNIKKIHCPNCGGTEIVYTTRYNRAPICRVLSTILITIFLFVLSFNLHLFFPVSESYINSETETCDTTTTPINALTPPSDLGEDDDDDAGVAIIILAISIVICKIYQHCAESVIRVQYVCKHCEHTWTKSSDT